MRILTFIFLLSLIGSIGCALAQAPESVKKTFYKKYPNAEDVSWGTDRNDFREAHFTLKGIKYRADFTRDGKWVETETNVKWKDLPEAVQRSFEERDKKKDIVEIELVDHFEKGAFYDIEFKTGGGKLDISIRPDGTVIGTDSH